LNITYTSTTGPSAQLVIGAQLKVNDWVIIRHQTYSFNAFSASNVKGIYWNDINLYATAGMGIFTNACSDIVIEGVRIVKLPGRPMSINADGLHISNTMGGRVLIDRCIFEGQGDDGINTPTIFDAIAAFTDEKNMSFTCSGYGNTITTQPVAFAGATLNFFDRHTMAVLGTAVVQSVSSSGVVTLATPLPPGAGIYTAFNNQAFYAGYIELMNSYFHANRARGAMIKSSNAWIYNNTFEFCSGPALKTETDACYWFEGHPVTNWTADSNRFLSNNFGPGAGGGLGDIAIDSYVAKFDSAGAPTSTCIFPSEVSNTPVQFNLTLTNNTFVQISGVQAVTAYSTQQLTIAGNSITEQGNKAQFNFQGFGVTDSALSNNVCNGGVCATSGL
jgi:hypothetical protein